ncbi:hypothetical protein HYH02_010480 [Chlamydomonas schloesseri]|uniref:Uncharacterized protein n=1 Tax=Chlamydomonas schloesseri TaxID=2026947 RepID=A0A835TB18_9CHLO|nr:hypothetical protein HYH02_010480 [Chlamydomonas schloesseri]|eukprot:KAG2439848.1 hypothetical protein HYH02_010480 [Chlamydomonas schloesseri]
MFPLGGLYEGHYAEQAIRRYWDLWMPLLFQHQRTREPAAAALLLPPLDVQWAWFVHRLNPNKYLEDCRARFGRELHPAGPQQALGFSGCSSGTGGGDGRSSSKGPPAGLGGGCKGAAAAETRPLSESEEYTRRAWAAAYPAGPGLPPEHQHWPPAPAWLAEAVAKATPRPARHGPQPQPQPQAQPHPHPQGQGGDSQQQQQQQQQPGQAEAAAAVAAAGAAVPGSTASVRSYVIEAMPRQGRFLHQVLRAPYFSHAWLRAGVGRYLRFLAMARTRAPSEPLLVPMYDIDLVWHSHMALSGAYAADCRALLPASAGGGGGGAGGGGGGGGGKVLGHDDGLAGPALADPFAFTRRKYEGELGLMYNVAPTRRIPTSLAHPLVAAVWPLAAVLADPRASAPPPPPPRAVAAQLAAQAREPQRLLACTVVSADGAVSWGPGGARNAAAAAAALAAAAAAGGGGGGSSSGSKGKAPSVAAGPGAGAGAGVGAGSGSSNGGAPSFATAAGEWAQCMLGSPDHLKRSGAVGLYALWRLAEALGQLAGPGPGPGGGGGGGAGCSHSSSCGTDRHCGDGAGSGSSGGRRNASSGGSGGSGGGVRMLYLLGCLGGGGGGDEARRVDEAMSRMTHDLLRLADPTSPHSPVSRSDHPFWCALLPLPSELGPPPSPSPPPSASPQGPARGGGDGGAKATPVSGTDTTGVHINVTATATACDADAAPLATSTTTSQADPTPPTQPPVLPPLLAMPPPSPPPPPPPRPSRFPAPPPALDVPAGFAPASARDVDCVWLAPHHFVLPAPVIYTHADLCTLGRGSWCLPPRLANPEASGGSADPRHLLPLQPPPLQPPPLPGPPLLQPPPARDHAGASASSSGSASTGSSGSQGPQLQEQQPAAFAGVAEEDYDFEWEEEDCWPAAGGGGGRGRRGRRGSSINALGAVVHSPAWHKRLLRCYSRVYAELMRQRKVQQPDRATAMAWGLKV